MPHYISLPRYTQKGLGTIKQGSARIDAARKAFEAAGGKLKAVYLTLSQYDAVAISEFPDDETAARTALAGGAQGNVRSETLRAFTEEEARKITAALP